MSRTVTLINGQAFVEEGTDDKWRLVPVSRWLEDRAAIHEIALAFELAYENRDTARFPLYIRSLLCELQSKYGDRWRGLFDTYLESPQAGWLLNIIDANGILSGQDR
ncbi:MAG: hypothetical protein A2Y60_01890 [Chloroflexi bacterium RBG_13_54_9]|nr:MAG: hypothetical protein A2Y60_01890 [Chloroflexi bacterium RBG_13_54_9]